MAIRFNGTDIGPASIIKYNGVSLKQVNENGVVVWKAEKTIFSNVSAQTGTASGPYEEQTTRSSEYDINFSEYNSIRCTGTAASVVVQTGEYSTYGGEVWLSVYVNGQWNDRYAKLATTSGSNMGGTYETQYNQTVDISSLSGSGRIRLYLWCKTANSFTTAKLYCKVSNASAIAV